VVGWRSEGRQRGLMCLVWRKMPDWVLHTKHIGPRWLQSGIFLHTKHIVRRWLQSGIFLHTKHIGPRCRPPDRQPTTTTGHQTTCCNLQSHAPYDGQMFVRNMLSWSWRSIVASSWSWFYYIAKHKSDFAHLLLPFVCLLHFSFSFRSTPNGRWRQQRSWNTRTELKAVCYHVALHNLRSRSSTVKCRRKHMHRFSATNVRAHQIAAAAIAPTARACIYRSCACRELVVVFENLKPLYGVELEHAVTSLNCRDRVFLRSVLCLCIV
jgi:hypothetical protein